jgi:hypothetical protein
LKNVVDLCCEAAIVMPSTTEDLPMINDLAIFASRFNVSVADAYVLPALFERTAAIAKMPVRAFIGQATFSNNALGQYLADCAKKIAIADREG